MGVGLVCSVIGFVWSLLIISIAWLFYRPIIGISLIVVATASIWLLWKKSKQKAKPAAANDSANDSDNSAAATAAS